MLNFERAEESKDNLGKNPEFIPLDELAVDKGTIPGEEEIETPEGVILGDHSEDGLEPDAEWENKLKVDSVDDIVVKDEVLEERERQAELIQNELDNDTVEEKITMMNGKYNRLSEGRSQVDRGIKDYDRETIRGEDAA